MNIKIFYYMSLGLLSYINLTAQTIWPSISHRSINRDSIFEVFIPPNLPKILFDSAGDFKEFNVMSFDVICFVGVSDLQKVKNIKLVPIYGYGNDIAEDSNIWLDILHSIDSVSKLWKFKPLLYEIKEEYPTDLKEYYTKINQKVLLGEHVRGRPLYGNQYHVIYLTIQLPYNYSDSEPDFIYHLKVIAGQNNNETEKQELYKQLLEENNSQIPPTIIDNIKSKIIK
jgi:hypothetical protein